jgi:ABC-type transporter Mla maintaining outer membrane lipid asymmetry ATPase subunit MlaF
MTAPALELRVVVGRSALGEIGSQEAVSFSLQPGEIGVILGGKEMSSLFRLILGLGELSSGQILLNGRVAIEPNVSAASIQALRQEIGFGFRDRGLLSNLSVLDNVDLPAKYHGRYQPGEAPGSHGGRALTDLGVDPSLWHLRPSNVTWEVRKLVLLARATVLKPRVLVLDDPSALFASTGLPDLMAWLNRQKASGTAILLGTNDYAFGLAVADWVLHPKKLAAVRRYDDFIEDTWIQSAKILAARMHAP